MRRVRILGVEMGDDAFGAVLERPRRERAHGLSAKAAAANYWKQTKGDFDIALFVWTANQSGDADQARRQSFAFIGQQHPAVPAFALRITLKMFVGPFERRRLERRRRPDRLMRYGDGVEEGGAA